MTGNDTFSFDHHRVTAGLALEPVHFAEMQRLAKVLRYGSGFQFLILEFNDESFRSQLARSLDDLLTVERIPVKRIDLAERGYTDILALEAHVRELAQGNCAIHLFGGDAWFDRARIEAFNIRREAFARIGPVKLLLWLTAAKIAELATSAPDLWSWRGSTVFAFTRTSREFHNPPAAQFKASAGMLAIDPRTLSERGQRIVELRAMMKNAAISDHARGLLLDELAGLLQSLGELDEALRIRKEEALPVYEKLGDVRSRAVTMGKIADILEARGELDEALRIRQEEELPVYEKLGDVRSRAVTTGKVADILQARGDLDEALRIRKDEELPVYEKLGDVRERAVTTGKIADILEARGELDEALRIRKDEELPVYEKLGDVRSRAVTMGKIADILEARGELDEALRIRKEEQLPVYEKLGDVRSRLIAEAQLGQLCVLKGEPEKARTLWRKALADAQRLRIPEAEIIEGWLNDLKTVKNQ